MNKENYNINRRQRERLNLSLPLTVKYFESNDESWQETTRLIDVTPFGAGFVLATRKVEIGRLVHLTIPMPRPLRVYDHLERDYQIWAVVRHARDASIGVAFIGKYPPASFYENACQLYEIIEPDAVGLWRVRELNGEHSKPERKPFTLPPQTEFALPLTVKLEVFNDRDESVASEITAAEHLNFNEALIFTTLEIKNGQFVRLTNDEYNVTIFAVIRSHQRQTNGRIRLHLEFIDRRFPMEAID